MLNLREQKILVTGGGGFLGAHVITALRERGVPEGNIAGPRSHVLDLRKFDDCRAAVKGTDLVIHLAAVTGGLMLHKSEPGRIFYDNLLMGVQLMEAARQASVKKFLSVGSATEYPASAPQPFKEEALWAGYPDLDHAPYAMAKKMLSVQGGAYRRQYGFNAIHLMPTNMYGPGELLESGYVIPSLIKRVLDAKRNEKDSIEVWGTGRALREFLYAEDAARGIVLAAEKYDRPEPVNLGSGAEISIKEIIELIAKFADYRGKIRWDASKPDGQLRRLLDASRAEKEFGFKAQVGFEAGLKKTIEWHLERVV